MGAGERIQRWAAILARQGLVILATIISLFPVYFMAVSSFKTKSEYINNKWGLPSSLFLTNFTTALAGEKFFIRFANSTILTALSVGASLMIACLAAYAFARMEFPGKDTLFNLVLSLMVVPPVVMVVPLFVSMVRWGLVNTYQGTSIIYIGLLLPFSVYMMTNFFRTIPPRDHRSLAHRRLYQSGSLLADNDAFIRSGGHHPGGSEHALGVE